MQCKFLLKFFLSLCALSLVAFADMDMHGQILSVDSAKKQIILQGPQGNIPVQVFPYTKLKGDDCGLFGTYDTYEKFNALQPGMFVEIDGYPQGQIFNAQEIEWKCGRRAY